MEKADGKLVRDSEVLAVEAVRKNTTSRKIADYTVVSAGGGATWDAIMFAPSGSHGRIREPSFGSNCSLRSPGTKT
jgi:hypothetical protein